MSGGKPLAEHQLVARHVAQLLAAEQTATRTCARQPLLGQPAA
ncbi:hypothetical protein [Micromonospora sp. NPDC002717]